MPSLRDLRAVFVRYESRVGTWTRVLGDPATWKPGDPTEEVTGPQEYTILDVPFAEAQGITFLCPKCFVERRGAVGTHACNVTFADRGVPDGLGSHDADGKPVRWSVTGSTLDDLSTQPSILLIGGCAWHGWITKGDAT